MDYNESNGHVTDDVMWSWKVKVVTPICLGPSISETAGDSDLVTMEHLQEIVTWESNGHMTDDVTWPWKVKVVFPIHLVVIFRKWLEIMIWWKLSTYKKYVPGNWMVTWPMTSRNSETSRSWPQYAYGPVSRKRLGIVTWWQWSAYR